MSHEGIMYCAKSKLEYFDYFHNHPKTVFACTDKFPIFKVKVTETENINDYYWAWWDSKEQKFIFVHKYQGGVTICFPYSLEDAEKHGRGKLVRVAVEIIEEINSL